LKKLEIGSKYTSNTEIWCGRINLRKLNELEIMKWYQIEFSNRFTAWENLSDSEDINRAWENIKENIKTLAKES